MELQATCSSFELALSRGCGLNTRMRSLHVISLVCCTALLTPARSADPSGKQVEQVLKVGEKSISFLLSLPKEYGAKETKWPLMLFLHGRGESDGTLRLVERRGPSRLVERGENFPFVLVSPQCPPRPNLAIL